MRKLFEGFSNGKELRKLINDNISDDVRKRLDDNTTALIKDFERGKLIKEKCISLGKSLRGFAIRDLQEIQLSNTGDLAAFTDLINSHYRDKDSFIEQYGQKTYDEFVDVLKCHRDLLESIKSEAADLIDGLLDKYDGESLIAVRKWKQDKQELKAKSAARMEKLHQH